MATKDKGLEKSLSKTLVDDIINQGTATINAVVGQQQTTIAAVTAHTDLEIARVGNATQAKKVELETKKDEMLIDINTQGGNAVTQAIATINSHTDDKKIDLDNHEQAKEVQMNELYSNLEAELQRLITEALQDRGVVINGADWHNLTSGNYYVSDLMGSGYINQPQLDPDENSGIVLVSTSGRGKYKIIRYYSVAKKMHFLINANNTWSEWSTVSEGGGLKYEYTQPNHGFTFNAVQLDGSTNTWVLADKDTGADGIAVRIDNNRFELAISGSYHIPSATRDSQNRVIEADEFYFLSNSQIGGFDKEKPIELFQPLFRTYLDEENRMLAEIDIDTPVNLIPRILVDEIESLDIATVSSTIRKENTIAELQRSNRYKIGDVVEVLGYYAAGDGAGHKRKIEQADDGSGVQLANGLWANLAHNGEVDVSWFGAKGDGITDDTIAFEKALNFKTNLRLQEKTYLIKKELFVDIQKMWLRGLSGRSVIKCSDDFVGENAITFYSGASGTWENRKNRINKHGNFSVIGNNTIKANGVNGVNTAGKRGTEKEGNTDQQIYENVYIENFNARLIYGSHVYKCLFINISGKIGNYCLKSEDNQYDSGEVPVFLNCAFWDGGKIDISHTAKFFGCTFQNNEHVFRGGNFQLTDCHFEQIIRSEQSDYIPFFIKSIEANIEINGGDSTIGSYNAKYKNVFVCEGRNGKMTITGGDWKYWLLRTEIENGSTFSKGNVVINNIEIQNYFEQGTNLNYTIYSNTTNNIRKNFLSNSYEFVKYGNLLRNETVLNVTDISDGIKVSINAKGDFGGSVFGLFKKYPTQNKKTIAIKIKVRMNTVGTAIQFQPSNLYSVGFLKSDGSLETEALCNQQQYKKVVCSQVGELVELHYSLAIPTQINNILVGVSGLKTPAETYEFDILKWEVELI